MKTKRYFPMFIDLSDKNVVVVGGGNIATRRVKTLLQFTRNVTAIAPKVTEELRGLGTAGYVNLITRPVKRSDFQTAYMVIAATNDWKLNDEIYRVCKEEGIYVNIADDGQGIPDDRKEKVFDLFYTGEYQAADGTRSMGVGLSLCRSIVEAHGGRLEVRDKVPRGTCFLFDLKAEDLGRDISQAAL